MADQRKRGPLRWVCRVFMLCGYVLMGIVGATYGLYMSRITIVSEAQLSHVAFGWPFPWLVEDHSQQAYARFPVTIQLPLPDKAGYSWTVPQHIDWLPAIGSTLFWGLVIWLFLRFILSPFLLRVSQAQKKH